MLNERAPAPGLPPERTTDIALLLCERLGSFEQKPGVLCVFAEEPAAIAAPLETASEAAEVPFSSVSVALAKPAPLGDELELVVQTLAIAALVRYPELYQTALPDHADGGAGWTRWPAAKRELAVHQVAAAHPGVSPQWLRRALTDCASGTAPRYRQLPLAAEAKQLALCLDPNRLVLALVVEPSELPPAHLLGLARAAEWLASVTGAAVILALHASYSGCAELDAVNYDAIHWRDDEGSDAATRGSDPPDAEARRTAAAAPSLRSALGARTDRVSRVGSSPPSAAPLQLTGLWPIIGRPHPLSPAEARLALALEDDAELADKFEWNQRVETRRGTRPVVDLLWREGHLIVEVDGFAYHSNRRAFEQDRQRDWELLVSGYRVVRLAASEVLEQTPQSLEKLRVATRFIQETR